MNFERMRRAARKLKVASALPCCIASLLVVALFLWPANSYAVKCTTTTTNPNPNPNPASFVSPGDFNGDCKSDILWQNGNTGQLYQWLMNGTTSFSQTSPGGAASPWGIVGVGDFNGDGMADILWQNSSTGQLYLWLMNGTTIASQTSLGTVNSAWAIVGIGDFNDDGKADVLWQNSSTGQLYLWLMNGATIANQVSPGTVASGWNIVGIGDFNGDGNADILWQNVSSGLLYVWLMNGATITTQANLGTVSSVWAVLGVGDFDGNGTSDILWQNSSTGQTYIWLMNGATIASQMSPGTAPPPQSQGCTDDSCSTVAGNGWSIVGTGDYDGSGRAGILWRNLTSGQNYIWLMNGATETAANTPGTVAPPWQVATLPPFGCSNQILCGILLGINAARANGPFPGTSAPWGPTTGTPNPPPSSEPGGALNPMVWDPGAATVAASWAAGCSATHNANRDGGENMDFGEGTFTGQSVAAGWDSEAANYVYPGTGGNCTPNDTAFGCGHYSQDVWRTTNAVGCALQQCPGTSNPFSDGNPWWYVICDFTPAGNDTGMVPY